MKYFQDSKGQVFAFNADGSQDDFITDDMLPMTVKEIDRHLNPQKYLSKTEKYAAYLKSLPPLLRKQFMLILIDNELDEALEAAINSIEDTKQRKKLTIEYKDSPVFERMNESVLFMFDLLGLTEAQVNELWEKGAKL